jgi:hypothetical protein
VNSTVAGNKNTTDGRDHLPQAATVWPSPGYQDLAIHQSTGNLQELVAYEATYNIN